MSATVYHDRTGWGVDFNGWRSAMPDEATARAAARNVSLDTAMVKVLNVLVAIVSAEGVRPGHADYLSKKSMAERARGAIADYDAAFEAANHPQNPNK